MNNIDIKTDETLLNIKKKILDITEDETGMPVYLKQVIFPESDSKRGSQCIINASCLFINEEGNVCADLFRTGTAGFMECVYGNIISSIGKRGLEEIYSALLEERWYTSEPAANIKVKSDRNRSRKRISGRCNNDFTKFKKQPSFCFILCYDKSKSKGAATCKKIGYRDSI